MKDASEQQEREERLARKKREEAHKPEEQLKDEERRKYFPKVPVPSMTPSEAADTFPASFKTPQTPAAGQPTLEW